MCGCAATRAIPGCDVQRCNAQQACVLQPVIVLSARSCGLDTKIWRACCVSSTSAGPGVGLNGAQRFDVDCYCVAPLHEGHIGWGMKAAAVCNVTVTSHRRVPCTCPPTARPCHVIKRCGWAAALCVISMSHSHRYLAPSIILPRKQIEQLPPKRWHSILYDKRLFSIISVSSVATFHRLS
jgi:hypothetical protein